MKRLFLILAVLISFSAFSQESKWTMDNIPMSFYQENNPEPNMQLFCCRLHDNGAQKGCTEGGICYCRFFRPCDDAQIIGRESVLLYFDKKLLDENNFMNIYFREDPKDIPISQRVFNIAQNVELIDGYYFKTASYNFDPNVGQFGGFKIEVGHNAQ